MEHHNLIHEFQALNRKIHELKISDNHFKKMFDEYYEINNSIKKIESSIESTSDEILNTLRLKRMHLKDDFIHHAN